MQVMGLRTFWEEVQLLAVPEGTTPAELEETTEGDIPKSDPASGIAGAQWMFVDIKLELMDLISWG